MSSRISDIALGYLGGVAAALVAYPSNPPEWAVGPAVLFLSVTVAFLWIVTAEGIDE